MVDKAKYHDDFESMLKNIKLLEKLNEYVDYVLELNGPLLVAVTDHPENRQHGVLFSKAALLKHGNQLDVNIDEKTNATVYHVLGQPKLIVYTMQGERPFGMDSKPLEDMAYLFKTYGVDCMIDSMDCRSEELPFRIQLLGGCIDHGHNCGHAPGLEHYMLKTIEETNFVKLATDAEVINRCVVQDDVVAYHAVSKKGTNFVTYKLPTLRWQTDAVLRRFIGPDGKLKGEIGNIPAGEVFYEEQTKVNLPGHEEPRSILLPHKAYGTWFCDVCIGGIMKNLMQDDSFVKLEVGLKNGKPEKSLLGKLTEISSSGDLKKQVINQWSSKKDLECLTKPYVQEFAIGLLNVAVTGNLLQDEKRKGFHMAIGRYFSHTDFLIDYAETELYLVKATEKLKSMPFEFVEDILLDLEKAKSDGYVTEELFVKDGDLVACSA